MTFAEAKRIIIPFGKLKGMTIFAAAETDAGLRWLDWARSLDDLREPFRTALHTYLADDTISREVDLAVNGN
jgi:hypothetical protein